MKLHVNHKMSLGLAAAILLLLLVACGAAEPEARRRRRPTQNPYHSGYHRRHLI